MARPIPEERVAAVQMRLAALVAAPVIERELATAWGCTTRTVRKLVAQVCRTWATTAAPEGEARRNELRARLELIYKVAIGKGQLTVALRALDQAAQLDGLLEPRRADASVSGAHFGFTSAEEVKARIADLTDRLRDEVRAERDGLPKPTRRVA